MLVTVIVPTLNRAGWLPACLGALVAQRTDDDTDVEVLVVDNGSGDDTREVLVGWANDQPCVRWTSEPRIGRSRALNAGVRAAHGELLLFTDDDAVPDPGWIGAHVDWFRQCDDRPAMAVGPIRPVMTDLGPWPAWFPTSALPDVPSLDHGRSRHLGALEYGWGANLAIPADVFARIGPWEEDIGNVGTTRRDDFEDTEFQDRVRQAGGSVWFCDDAIVFHRVPPDRLTPRAVIRSAHARGIDDRRRALDGRSLLDPDERLPGAKVRIGEVLRDAALWPVRAAVFRARPGALTFERLRHIGWRCGWDRTAVATEWNRAGELGHRLLLTSRQISLRMLQ